MLSVNNDGTVTSFAGAAKKEQLDASSATPHKHNRMTRFIMLSQVCLAAEKKHAKEDTKIHVDAKDFLQLLSSELQRVGHFFSPKKDLHYFTCE